MNNFIKHLPKAELHVHLVGTLEPGMLMQIAERNNIKSFDTLAQAQKAYTGFNSLDSFVNTYDLAVSVLKSELDFYELTLAYLKKVSAESVLRSEFFFEVQNFEQLDISFATIMNGMTTAITEAQKKYGIIGVPLLCFLRQMSEESALHTLKQSLQYKDVIIGCGLAGTEQGNPPKKFKTVFANAQEYGYKTTIHAGEDAGPDYIWQAINELHVDRIDHGVRCIEDPALVNYLKETQLPLTVCPISNVLLNVFNAHEHPVKKLLDIGLNISLHSDDPAFFDGYINANYMYAHHKMGLTREQLVQCARNSLIASFASEEEKAVMIEKLKRFVDQHQ